jgi:hypothetical protein
MSLAKMAWTGLLVATLSVLAVGCRGKTAPSGSPQAIELKQFHAMYQHFVKSEQKPPRQLSDLAKKQYEGIYPVAVRSLQQGKYVVVWNVQGKEAGAVLAYEKDAPTQGGAVLMADGTVRIWSADELKAALPAK